MMPSTSDMERVSVQLTAEAKKQIYEWATEAKVKPGYFMSMALTVGARALAKQLHPEQFMGPEVWRAVAEGLGVDPEELQRKLQEEAEAKKAA